jgi:vacuolar-type H+-ATPase subunit I/STV1
MLFRRRVRSTPAYEPAVADDRYLDERATDTHVVGTTWSPAQIVALGVGVFFVILGIVALTKTGLSTSHLYRPRETVWTFPHTPLLALSEIGFGALMLVAGIVPGASRVLMGLLGVIALVFGLVILIGTTPAEIVTRFAVNDRNGWLYTLIGAGSILVAMLMPVIVHGGGRTVHRERNVGTYA